MLMQCDAAVPRRGCGSRDRAYDAVEALKQEQRDGMAGGRTNGHDVEGDTEVDQALENECG
jgi:hypothetical protein